MCQTTKTDAPASSYQRKTKAWATTLATVKQPYVPAYIRRRRKANKMLKLVSEFEGAKAQWARVQRNTMDKIRRQAQSGSMYTDLGCTPSQFKEYIEQQFQPDMSWETCSITWELSFKDPEAGVSLRNTQPTWLNGSMKQTKPSTPKPPRIKAPKTKRCRRCLRILTLVQFKLGPKDQRLGHLCRACRKEKKQ